MFYLCVLFANIEHTKLCSIPSLGAILDIYLKFREFQPRCSHETYFHKNEECITVARANERKRRTGKSVFDRASQDLNWQQIEVLLLICIAKSLLLTGTPLPLFFAMAIRAVWNFIRWNTLLNGIELVFVCTTQVCHGLVDIVNFLYETAVARFYRFIKELLSYFRSSLES